MINSVNHLCHQAVFVSGEHNIFFIPLICVLMHAIGRIAGQEDIFENVNLFSRGLNNFA